MRAAPRALLQVATRSTAQSVSRRAINSRHAHALARRPASQSQNAPSTFETPSMINETTGELFYSEDELSTFYRELLNEGGTSSNQQPEQIDTPAYPLLPQVSSSTEAIISELEKRFTQAQDQYEPVGLVAALTQRQSVQTTRTPMTEEETLDLASMQPHQRLLHRLTRIVEDTEASYSDATVAGPSSGMVPPGKIRVSLGLVSYKEWFGVIQHCLELDDVTSIEKSFDLMKRSGMRPPAAYYEHVVQNLSQRAKVNETESFLAFMRKHEVAISETAIHHHVKAYTRNRRLQDACTVIHSYEETHSQPSTSQTSSTSSLPALPLQKTYTLVIGSLLAQNQPHSRALAWDMFAHMRYVAHPVPDAQLYSVMLRACANASPDSQVERAVDLWTEMRQDNKIAPTKEAYNGLILSCARAAKDGEGWANEAFRLAREMLDAYRAGNASLRPDNETFTALLESAKRTGDLGRARWILAELVGAYESGRKDDVVDLAPNESVMANVFQVYASYQPPNLRNMTRVAPSRSSPSASDEKLDSPPTTSSSNVVKKEVEESPRTNTPQSHAEAAAEASIVFERILSERVAATNPSYSDSPTSSPVFDRVQPTTHLFNSYLSVHLSHSSLAKARDVYKDIFSLSIDDRVIRKSPRTFVLAMERCARAKGKYELEVAEVWIKELWEEWSESGLEKLASTSPRNIEKIWSAMIRVLTLTNKIDKAIELIHTFTSTYPPPSLSNFDSSESTTTTQPNAPVRYQTHTRAHLIQPLAQSQSTAISDSVSPSTPLPDASTTPSLSEISATSQPPPTPHPLIQLATPTLISDPTIPPYLSFSDIELLHQRLLVLNRTKDLSYLNWMTRAYKGNIRKRREGEMSKLGGKKRVFRPALKPLRGDEEEREKRFV